MPRALRLAGVAGAESAIRIAPAVSGHAWGLSL
jgi:hypothetical protein